MGSRWSIAHARCAFNLVDVSFARVLTISSVDLSISLMFGSSKLIFGPLNPLNRD